MRARERDADRPAGAGSSAARQLVQSVILSGMTFTPVVRRPVSEAVFDDVRAAVLSGRLAPGTALAPERVLSEQFGVNRHAVREALKRLQQAGLVEVNHGGATRVLDWRATGGLDLLPHLPFALGDGPAPEALRSILEMRRSLGVDVARLAAERVPASLLAMLREHARDGADPAGDIDELGIRYEEIWRGLVAASDNVAYTLAYNSLLAGTSAVAQLSYEIFAAEVRDLGAHADLIDAVAARDGTRAAESADALLRRTLATALAAADAAPARLEPADA